MSGAVALERSRRRIDPIELLGRFAPTHLIVLAVIFTIRSRPSPASATSGSSSGKTSSTASWPSA